MHTLDVKHYVERHQVFLGSLFCGTAGAQRTRGRLLWRSVPVISGLNPARIFFPDNCVPCETFLSLAITTWQLLLTLPRLSVWLKTAVLWILQVCTIDFRFFLNTFLHFGPWCRAPIGLCLSSTYYPISPPAILTFVLVLDVSSKGL